MPDPSTARSSADDRCREMQEHLAEARKLICLANRKGIRIHQDVLELVVQADRTCAERGQISAELETRFWHAYGILRRTIQPATRARSYYRGVFYVALALMLLVQCYFMFGSRVHEQVGKLRTEQAELLGEQQLQAQGAAGASANIAERLEQNSRAQAAYRELALRMVPGSATALAAVDGATPADSRFEVALATLKMVLDFLAAYLLPALYGLLGACAFVLRQLSADLSRDFSTLRFAHDSRVRYSLRLNIGILGGLAVGWFIDPTAEGSVVANLSPLALAFVAGYGSDLLFAVLDRIVSAFATQQSDDQDDDRSPAQPALESEARQASATTGTNGKGKSGSRGKRTNGAQPRAAPA